MSDARQYVVSTAGHVDHGKSALIKALTGTDPDRLPEEKARGITIDLGFAFLELRSPDASSSLHIGIVDVPGHEDFVKNMVAGVGSVDLALVVVAADDGWMPQTEEHLQILTYAGVRRAVVALVERGGGARAVHLPKVTNKNVREVLARHADRKSRLHTDESRLYPVTGRAFAAHETVRHSAGEYARGDVHTNSAEGFFGIFKRGMVGVYHHCGEQHLQRYLDEFAFRHSHRVKLGVHDAERAALALKGAEGKRLTYRRVGRGENAEAERKALPDLEA